MLKKLSNHFYLAHIALLVTTIIWGIASVVIKITLEEVPVNTFLFLRFLVVAIVLLPFTIIELKRNQVDKRDIFNIVLLGIFAHTSLIFIFEGLKYTSAVDSAIIGVISPLLTIAAGHYFFRERVSYVVKIGVIVATVGTLIVALEPVLSASSFNAQIMQRLWGNFLVILNTLAFLLYVVWSKISLGERSVVLKRALNCIHLKPMRKKYSSFLLMSTSFYIGLLSFIPGAILENLGYFGSTNFSFATMSIKAIAGVLYMALLSSIVAYTLFEWALHDSTVRDTAIYSYLTPLFTLPVAYLLLKETPTAFALVGASIIGLGVIIAERKKT